MLKARGYEGMHDLHAMLNLLTEGRQADNGTYYVHPGDLQWWLFYTDVPQETWQSQIRLWFDPGNQLVGWALLSLGEEAFDVYVSPHLRGDAREEEMLAWATESMSANGNLQNIWVAEDDDVRIRWMEKNGFARAQEHFIQFKQSLSDPLDGPRLPGGFRLRTSRGPEDARLRSVASHAAFGSGKPFEEYWPRTRRFMKSPVYVPEHEIFVVAPNGEVAAFCIVWTDARSKVGHFEPVATHPNYQRMGLGKSLLFEGMRTLKFEGMTESDVCTNDVNAAAIRLYESVGFQKAKRLFTYKKARTT